MITTEELQALNDAKAMFMKAPDADTLTMDDYNAIIANMPVDIADAVERIIHLMAKIYYRDGRYPYKSCDIMEKIRFTVSKWNHGLTMTLNELILYIMDWNYFIIRDHVNVEPNLTFDDFKFVIVTLNEIMTSVNHDFILGHSADNILLGLHRRGWTDGMIADEIKFISCYNDRTLSANELVKAHVKLEAIQNTDDADDYLNIINSMVDDPHHSIMLDAFDYHAGYMNTMLKLVRIPQNADRTLIPNSICDYMDFKLHCAFNEAHSVKHDSYVSSGIIDALCAFNRMMINELSPAQAALALDFTDLYACSPMSCEYGRIEYIDMMEAGERERGMIMRMADNGLFHVIRDYPREFTMEWMKTYYDCTGLEYYDENGFETIMI